MWIIGSPLATNRSPGTEPHPKHKFWPYSFRTVSEDVFTSCIDAAEVASGRDVPGKTCQLPQSHEVTDSCVATEGSDR